MTTQSEALRLAELMEQPDDSLRWADGGRLIPQAAAELRRLHALNAELLEALKDVIYWDNAKPEWEVARAVIARAEGEQA